MKEIIRRFPHCVVRKVYKNSFDGNHSWYDTPIVFQGLGPPSNSAILSTLDMISETIA